MATFQDLMGSGYSGSDESLSRLYHKNQQNFEELLHQLKKGTIVPLFGAGFSGAAYPGWAKLLRNLAKPFPDCTHCLEHRLASGEFEEAASLLCNEMGEFEFLEELHDTFGPQTLPEAIRKVSKQRKAIPHIFTGPLMTTNVEQVIEELYGRKLPVLCPHTDYHQPQAERALQSSVPILYKLHGDIEDREHVVFTKEQYDAVYDSSAGDSTLVQTLKQIFSAKTVLFLGCSLESDRVLEVLERCCGSHVYYALAELPEETKNDVHPFAPDLLNADGTEKEAYRRRRQFMSKHHIKCIWYPFHEFNSLDVFLQELQTQCGTGSSKPPSNIPAARRTVLGRDEIIGDVYQHCMTGNCPVFVTGTGGIGKTEVCHMVLRRMEQEDKDILYVNVTDLQEPAALCRAMAQAAGAGPLPDDQAVKLPVYLDYVKEKISACPQAVLYLDNWEDLWYATKEQDDQRLQMLEWMAELCHSGVPVLLSSRISPEEYDVTVKICHMPTLDRKSGVDKALFRQVYESKQGHLPLEGDCYEKLLEQLDGHPLTIVLTATQAAGAASWDSVLARWTQAAQKTSNPRHNRLDTALQMSWDGASESPGCIMVWGLIALSQGDPAYSQLMELAENELEQQQWENSVRLLRNASLLDWSEDGTALQMLQPIKEAFFLLADEQEGLPCFERWEHFFLPVLEQANDLNSPCRQTAHVRIMEQLPQILYLMEHMLANPWRDSLMVCSIALVKNILNYLQYNALQSLLVCERLENMLYGSCHQILLAQIIERRGDLFNRLGSLDKAEEMYQQAEALFRQERDNLGLANTLQSRGDLFSRLGKPDKAEEMYQQAEALFRQEQANLGLANTLKSLGDLFSHLGNTDKVEEMYQKAEILYRQERDSVGLANTLKSQGELFSRLGKPDKAEEMYQQAEALFRQEHDNLGLANTLKSQGDLFRRRGSLDKAEEMYQQAEALFHQERDNLGLANTLKSQGDLFRRLDNLDKAEQMYQQAEILYCQERDNLGLANTFQSQGDLFRHQGNLDKAEQMYQQAEILYRQEQANLGLANTLKSRGDLFSRLGKPDKAEEMYQQAEALFRQEQSSLGLANTLKSQGILHIVNNDESRAADLFQLALSCYESAQEPYGVASTCALLSIVLTRSGSHSEEAMSLAQKAKEIAESLPPGMKEHILSLLEPYTL